jgi:predicted metal-binding protein
MKKGRFSMKYIQQALKMGAKNAVRFEIGDIVFDPRVVLKCIFGCGDFGRNHTCPYQKSPLAMKEYEEIFSRYKWGIIFGCADKNTSQKISFEIERLCFLDGYYFAFSLSDCGLCKECSKVSGEPCRVPAKARPAFHSVGIDVFKTVKKFDLPLYVAQDQNAELNWYSAVFVE